MDQPPSISPIALPDPPDPDADDAMWAEFGGEICEEDGYHAGPELIHPAVLHAAAWSPYAYAAVLHQLLDTGLRAVSGSAGRLLLQLVRETAGRGKSQVSLSLDALRDQTGLQKATLIRALTDLQAAGLVMVTPGGSHRPATYQVQLSKILRAHDTQSPVPARFSIEYRLSELNDADRAELLAVERGLTPALRHEIATAVRQTFLALGQTRPDPAQFTQAVRYQLLQTCFAPARLRKAYPHWFEFPSTL